ncbi:hypothetical protein MMC30_002826 [Trapelia coarctata]|nr:hypothetical protein [Trapelia coarctata]
MHKVLIVGAGMGGLALAQALRKQRVPFEIFDREAGPYERSQGWAIGLSWILKDLLSFTPDDLPPIETCSVSKQLGLLSRAVFYDAYTGRVFLEMGGRKPNEDGYFVRVNRAEFRGWLSEHIDINWNKRFSHYEETDSGVTAYFHDGTSAAGSILVGADGINSPVRTQLFSATPPQLNRVPLATIWGEVTLTKEQYEHQVALAPSFYMAQAEDFRIFIATKGVSEDKATSRYYWFVSWIDPAAAEHDFWTLHASREELLEYAATKVAGAHPKFLEVIQLTKPEGIVCPPIRLRDWLPGDIPRGRVTLLGDAIHPMTFFRGEGANHALQDGLKLANVLAEAFGPEGPEGPDIADTLEVYEKEMLQRGRDAVLESRAAAENQNPGSVKLPRRMEKVLET